MQKILNLTQHYATPDQIAEGVVDLVGPAREALIDMLTFDEPPTPMGVARRAKRIAELATKAGAERVMIGGAPYLMASLEKALFAAGIEPFYAFTRREVVETVQADGIVRKVVEFRHAGWVMVGDV
jgi:hypothetical protein